MFSPIVILLPKSLYFLALLFNVFAFGHTIMDLSFLCIFCFRLLFIIVWTFYFNYVFLVSMVWFVLRRPVHNGSNIFPLSVRRHFYSHISQDNISFWRHFYFHDLGSQFLLIHLDRTFLITDKFYFFWNVIIAWIHVQMLLSISFWLVYTFCLIIESILSLENMTHC